MVAMNSPSHKVAELSWEDVASGTFPPTPKQLFAQAVLTEAAKAKSALPPANGRIERARDLVLGNLVQRQADYSFVVRSASQKGKSYVVDRDGHCECPDSIKVQGGRCQHVLATWIWRKARRAVEAQHTTGSEDAIGFADDTPDDMPSVAPPQTPLPEPEASQAASSIPSWALVDIKGKQFVLYAGLLAMAHERGLVKLTAHFISVTPELALAEGTAEFADGRVFHECADSTPGNVGKQVQPHFARLALTRAKARCLRDALSISMAAVEELEG
jgi:hypothetical protein